MTRYYLRDASNGMLLISSGPDRYDWVPDITQATQYLSYGEAQCDALALRQGGMPISVVTEPEAVRSLARWHAVALAVLAVALPLLTACTGTPSSPSPAVGSSSSQVTAEKPVGPSATDDQAYQVRGRLRDKCDGQTLVDGHNGGRSAFPVHLTFSGPSSIPAMDVADPGDFSMTLPEGTWTVRSVTSPASSGSSGYQTTDSTFKVPDSTDWTIYQVRDCGPAVPPPPPPPPPIPPPVPPPVPPPPPPPFPLPCQETNPPGYSTLKWDNTAEGLPIAVSVDVRNEGRFTVGIEASFDMVTWIDKGSDSVVLACGQSAHLVHAYLLFAGHQAGFWRYWYLGPTGGRVTGAIFVRF